MQIITKNVFYKQNKTQKKTNKFNLSTKWYRKYNFSRKEQKQGSLIIYMVLYK